MWVSEALAENPRAPKTEPSALKTDVESNLRAERDREDMIGKDIQRYMAKIDGKRSQAAEKSTAV